MKLYQFETHCHTAEASPCGILAAAQVVDGMKAAGYMGTFITDHFYARFFERPDMAGLNWDDKVDRYLKGYKAAKARGDEIGVKVFLGLEVQPEDSPYEFLTYGPDETFLKENGPFYRLSTPAFYDLMHSYGFLVFQAHPYRYGLSPENPKYYDGVEMVNAQPRNESRNKMALKFAFENDIMTIAGSDIHKKEDIGRCGIMLPGSINSPADFIAYYKKVRNPELIITYGV